jgi:hypothetical protein
MFCLSGCSDDKPTKLPDPNTITITNNTGVTLENILIHSYISGTGELFGPIYHRGFNDEFELKDKQSHIAIFNSNFNIVITMEGEGCKFVISDIEPKGTIVVTKEHCITCEDELTITNQTGDTVHILTMWEAGTDPECENGAGFLYTKGLNEEFTLADGSSHTLTLDTALKVDIALYGEEHVYFKRNVEAKDTIVFTIDDKVLSPGEPITITIVNNIGMDICDVFIMPSGIHPWELVFEDPDALIEYHKFDCYNAEGCLQHGQSVVIETKASNSRFDIWLAGFCEHWHDYVMKNQFITDGTTFTFTSSHHDPDCYECNGLWDAPPSQGRAVAKPKKTK